MSYERESFKAVYNDKHKLPLTLTKDDCKRHNGNSCQSLVVMTNIAGLFIHGLSVTLLHLEKSLQLLCGKSKILKFNENELNGSNMLAILLRKDPLKVLIRLHQERVYSSHLSVEEARR